MAVQVKSIFSDSLKDGTAAKIKLNSRETRDWFRQRASEVRNVNVNSLVSSFPGNNRTKTVIGKMYLFQYSAKHKETLPYYDRFPLVFPIEGYPDGFLGINLHYLPHLYRARLMDALYSLMVADNIDGNAKLKLSYQVLKSTTKLRYAEPCIKRYLYKQVRSNFLLISPEEWDVALFLPLERFTKNSNVVHRDSTRFIASKQ